MAQGEMAQGEMAQGEMAQGEMAQSDRGRHSSVAHSLRHGGEREPPVDQPSRKPFRRPDDSPGAGQNAGPGAPQQTLACLLQQARTRSGRSQAELAERAGLSVAAVAAIEQGQRQHPYPHTLRQLADALQLSDSEHAALLQAAKRSRGARSSSVSAPANALDETLADILPTLAPAIGEDLPAYLTSLVGREHEQAAAVHLLGRPSVRLLTLTGPGGVGKTRLAVQVADGIRKDFDDGICFVSLAQLGDPALVIPAIAQALRLREGSRPVHEMLRAHLRERRTLLVLDNFEHLLAAGPEVVQTVAECRGVKLLVTSRSPLRVRGEHEMAVAPLEVPDAPRMSAPMPSLAMPSAAMPSAAMPSLADLGRYSAVTLFVQRAQAVRPTFELAADNADAVANICRHVDGLPLAIELAAARIRLLAPAALLDRLGRRLTVLTGGARDLPERQQTLRATLDWSYHLLAQSEQRLLRRLAVFTSGWTLEAAEAVCAEAERLGVTPVGVSVLAALESLMDSSLVRQVEYPDGSPWYTLLETVREYALEQLEDAAAPGGSREAELLREAQANYYLSLPEGVAPVSLGQTVIEGLQRLQREHANLRAALAWAMERRETSLGLRLADALGRFWWQYGQLSEGRSWLEGLLALALPGEVSSDLRARALHGAGVLATAQGDLEQAVALLEQALALYRESARADGVGRVLNTLGGVAYDQGDLDRARVFWEESLALARTVGDVAQVSREVGNLGEVYYFQGNGERALALFEESLALGRQSGRVQTVAIQLGNLAKAAYRSGDIARATALLRESLGILQSLGDRRLIAADVELIAIMSAADGEAACAAKLFGAATWLRASIGAKLPSMEQREIEEAGSTARAAIGEQRWEAESLAARKWPVEQAIQEALTALHAVEVSFLKATPTVHSPPPLTTGGRE